MRNLQLRHELRAGCVLHAVDGPQRRLVAWLGGVRDGGCGRVGLGARMVGGKGDVCWRMPVACGKLDGEGEGEEGVDGGCDGAGVGDGERAVL